MLMFSLSKYYQMVFQSSFSNLYAYPQYRILPGVLYFPLNEIFYLLHFSYTGVCVVIIMLIWFLCICVVLKWSDRTYTAKTHTYLLSSVNFHTHTRAHTYTHIHGNHHQDWNIEHTQNLRKLSLDPFQIISSKMLKLFLSQISFLCSWASNKQNHSLSCLWESSRYFL